MGILCVTTLAGKGAPRPRHSLACSLVVLAALAFTSSANATPIQYLFDSGSVTLTASVGGGNISAPVTADLDGLQTTIDEAAPELVSIGLTASGPIVLDLSPAYLGYTTLTIDSLSLSGGSTPLTLVGAGPPASEYFFAVNPLTFDLVVSAVGPMVSPLMSVPLSGEAPGSGSLFVDPGLNQLSLSGITIGNFTPLGPPSQSIVVIADFNFSASPVPEPSTALLFVTGFLAITARRDRN